MESQKEYYKELIESNPDFIFVGIYADTASGLKKKDRQNEPEIINRNRIMHGLFSREISQKDCLQLFCVISNMVVIKSIIDASEMMDKTLEELKQLQQETN